jgi:hypothetical protein
MAAHRQPASATPWTATAVRATSTSAGSPRVIAARTLAASSLRGGSGMVPSWRSQPLPRSWAMRGPLADSTAPMAPKAPMETMIPTSTLSPSVGGWFPKTLLNSRYRATGMAMVMIR